MGTGRRQEDDEDFPVADTLSVVDGETIYKTDDWWKALVTYHYDDSSDSTDVDQAVYLWHNDDNGTWRRKQKYLVRSHETWESDRELIDEFLESDCGDNPVHKFDRKQLPVNDFLTVGDAARVFKTEDWWKAVVRIDAKGDWETREVVVYVWQFVDEEWRRRQKYAIKRKSDWEKESALITHQLDERLDVVTSEPEQTPDTSGDFDPEAAKRKLQKNLKRKHLGKAIE